MVQMSERNIVEMFSGKLIMWLFQCALNMNLSWGELLSTELLKKSHPTLFGTMLFSLISK